MSRFYFFSDDFFFLNGMREHYKDSDSACEFINTGGSIDDIKDKIASSCGNDVFIFSFECKDLFKELLTLDKERVFNFVVIIDTPMHAEWVCIGKWFVTSKVNTFAEMDQAITLNRAHLTERRPLSFTKHEKAVWTLQRGGETINDIAKFFRLSPKSALREGTNCFMSNMAGFFTVSQ